MEAVDTITGDAHIIGIMRASRGIAKSQRARGIHSLKQNRRVDPKVLKVQKLEAKVNELSKLVIDSQTSNAEAAKTVSAYAMKIAELEAFKAQHEQNVVQELAPENNQSFN